METPPTGYLIEIITIVAYLLAMVSVGIIFNRFNKNTDDYFRSGMKGTWWLVGSSSFMISFSAWTFTGAAGAAFMSGWAVLFIYLGNVCGYFLCAAFLAPWLRQLRITTTPEVYEMRYTESTRQLIAYLSFFSSLFYSGLMLYGLSIFCSAVFGLNIQVIIVGLGIVVLAYAMSGGSWAVLATDFLQGMILIPMTILITVLCLNEVGGISSMFHMIRDQGLSDEYRMFHPERAFNITYSLGWGLAIFINNTLQYLTFNNAVRYASVKDGSSARKAALMAGILTLLGALIWMIPPIVGRLLYADEILASGIAAPAEAAYAITAMKLLPAGLTGIMVVAIFSATMSTMDTGLNRNAAIAVKDIYPQLMKLLGRTAVIDQKKLVGASRVVTLTLGACVIGMALYMSSIEGKGIFDLMLYIMVAAGTPIAPSALFGFFIRRIPKWGALASIISAWVPALLGIFSARIFGEEWSFQLRFVTTFGTASTVILGSTFFWNAASAEYKAKAAAFFKRRNTRIDFESEVGAATDYLQLKILGVYLFLIGLGIAVLGFVPEQTSDRIVSWAFAGVIVTIGAVMIFLGQRLTHVRNSSLAAH